MTVPELPAMENFRRAIEAHSLNRKIAAVTIKRDRVVRIEEKVLKDAAVGQKLTMTKRHGKYVFVRIGVAAKATWLAFHCGMTGYFTYPQHIEDEKTIDKAKLVLEFADGGALAFYDPRRFGSVELIGTPEDFIARHKLGIDAADIGETEFIELLAGSGKAIKSLFLDQSVMAGIGNVYGDEIPFQAKISPKRNADDLSKAEASRLYRAMVKVWKTAIEKKAYLDHWDMLPKSWLVHYREEDTPCPRCDHAITPYKAGGRDGYFCPGCQK